MHMQRSRRDRYPVPGRPSTQLPRQSGDDGRLAIAREAIGVAQLALLLLSLRMTSG